MVSKGNAGHLDRRTGVCEKKYHRYDSVYLDPPCIPQFQCWVAPCLSGTDLAKKSTIRATVAFWTDSLFINIEIGGLRGGLCSYHADGTFFRKHRTQIP